MSTVRRVYLYLVAFVSLHVAAFGAAALARAVIESVAFSTDLVSSNLRRDVALNGAYLLVGLPLWLVHWRWAAHAAGADFQERAATLRRLYLYLVLAIMLAAIASASQNVLEALFRAVTGEDRSGTFSTGREIVNQIPWLLVGAALWVYHRRTAEQDRLAAGEDQGGATLRRWYAYGVAFVAAMYLLRNASRVLRLAWRAWPAPPPDRSSAANQAAWRARPPQPSSLSPSGRCIGHLPPPASRVSSFQGKTRAPRCAPSISLARSPSASPPR